MRLRVRFQLLALFVLLSVVAGCEDEPGRVRVTRETLVGMYETNFENGRELLELKNDGTYTQRIHSSQGITQHSGRWEIENHFLNGSDVNLIDAVISEDDAPSVPQRIGYRTLNVHERNGKLALALNESADWYFNRVE